MATILTLVIFGILILRSVKRTRSSSPPPNRSASPSGHPLTAKAPIDSEYRYRRASSSRRNGTTGTHATAGTAATAEPHTIAGTTATKTYDGDSSSRRQIAAEEASEPFFGDEAFSLESENVEEIPIQIISLDEGEKKHHGLDLTEGGILNGIILSEILGPPMARRNRIR